MSKTGTDANYIKKPFHPNVQNNEESEDIFDKPILQSPMKIVEKFNLSENTQTKFVVDSMMSRIIINVDGNVSKASLHIPMNATVPWPGTVISWRRKADTDGVRIDTRNAPPGEWWMKLTGEENSNYHFTANGFVEERRNGEKLFLPEARVSGNFNEMPATKYQSFKSSDFIKTTDSEVLIEKQDNLDAMTNSKPLDNGKITSKRSLEHQSFGQEQTNQMTIENLNDDTNTENVISNYVEYVTYIDDNKNLTAFSNNSNNNEEILDKILPMEEDQKINARSSIGLAENVDVDDIRMSVVNDASISMKVVEALDDQELSQELVTNNKENTIEGKRMLIEVNKNSNLLVTPGTIHRIVFDVKNGCILPVRYAFRVKSTPFRVVGLQPNFAWIYPEQMSNVAVDLIIPNNAAPDTANTVTLYIPGTEIKEKSVYLYVQGSLSKLTDDVKPKIDYSFNSNCAEKLAKNRCSKSHWSMDITIQDYDSGLKRVISSPNEIYPRTEFISGTRSPVTFYYFATCCDTSAKITAIDLLDNYDTLTADVTVWNNLSEAQIAAISVGALLGILLIILIVILIIYCFRSKKSHDLPYTQRYGSRSPPRAERTSF
ncbi:uncharacterized protein LOC143186202 [Calliopsis andreniformis]|uniref:uncharacterized protein LOC143186202 n=1 Tax=Calliopsis andreniformis TaxID=337506 RepID=UPI003FCCC275